MTCFVTKTYSLYQCKFSGRRLPVASSIRTEHEYNDVQRSVRRAMSSVESRIDKWSITDISAISAQHPRDVTHLSRDREIRERYRDLISYILMILFLPFILHCDNAEDVFSFWHLRFFFLKRFCAIDSCKKKKKKKRV